MRAIEADKQPIKAPAPEMVCGLFHFIGGFRLFPGLAKSGDQNAAGPDLGTVQSSVRPSVKSLAWRSIRVTP